MGKIACVFEDCLFNIGRDKKSNFVFNPNQKIINFIKEHIDNGYNFDMISNQCENEYIGLDILLKQHDIKYNNIFYTCNDSKMDIILQKIHPNIYIDTHIELCAGLQFYGIDTYICTTESLCISKNKCATGIKTL